MPNHHLLGTIILYYPPPPPPPPICANPCYAIFLHFAFSVRMDAGKYFHNLILHSVHLTLYTNQHGLSAYAGVKIS